MMTHAARPSRPVGTTGHARTAPVSPETNHRFGRRASCPPGLRPSTARNVHRTFRPSGPAADPRGAGTPSTNEEHAPGPTRGPDPRRTAAASPPEVPDQVRDGGRSRQDPLPGRDVQNVETRSATCPETYKPESPRP